MTHDSALISNCTRCSSFTPRRTSVNRSCASTLTAMEIAGSSSSRTAADVSASWRAASRIAVLTASRPRDPSLANVFVPFREVPLGLRRAHRLFEIEKFDQVLLPNQPTGSHVDVHAFRRPGPDVRGALSNQRAVLLENLVHDFEAEPWCGTYGRHTYKCSCRRTRRRRSVRPRWKLAWHDRPIWRQARRHRRPMQRRLADETVSATAGVFPGPPGFPAETAAWRSAAGGRLGKRTRATPHPGSRYSTPNASRTLPGRPPKAA